MEISGLTQSEVKKRKLEGQINNFSKNSTKTIREIVIENIFSVFNLMIFLILAFVLFYYFKTNDIRLLLDCIGISSIAILNVVIAIYQEIKAKIALDKVNLLLVKTVNVIRDGKLSEISHSQIVKDDVIKIDRGDQIIVDGIVIQSSHLEIDESLLTGESVPIEKNEDDKVLSGSFCVSGTGYYKAEKIGEESYASKITKLAKKYKFVLTPLQKKLNLILKLLFSVAILLVLLKLIFIQQTNLSEVDFVRQIATILTSLIPQGLILTASITYALGVIRISKIGAIIQKLNAIESFSSIKVVCMDKTGTLTQNKLSVNKITPLNNSIDTDTLNNLIGSYAHLIQSKNTTSLTLEIFKGNDSYKLKNELPFSSSNKYSLAEISDANTSTVYILGAFDILQEKLNPQDRLNATEVYEKENLNSFRNLLFGKFPENLEFDYVKNNFNSNNIIPLGIISIADTVRDDVSEVFNLFQKNNIAFKILSGDSADAISSIIDKIGWNISKDKYITGAELDKLTPKEFTETIINKEVFSRLSPEHKLKIIKSLKSKKLYTAMIGDGVNDLPAIKESDMGIAMEEGSSVTKEIADIVLLKNKFSILPEIFNEGNKIVNSVNLVAKLFLTKNFMVILLTIFSFFEYAFPLFQYPITPRRVSLINIFAIGLPSFIISFKNQNINSTKKFLKDILTYVTVSSTIIVFSTFLSKFIVIKFLRSSQEAGTMVAISIIILLSIFNFLIISKYTFNKPLTFYLYAIALVSLYVIVAITDVNIGVFGFIRKFYEIESFKGIYWIAIIVVSIFGGVMLFYFNKLRENTFNEH